MFCCSRNVPIRTDATVVPHQDSIDLIDRTQTKIDNIPKMPLRSEMAKLLKKNFKGFDSPKDNPTVKDIAEIYKVSKQLIEAYEYHESLKKPQDTYSGNMPSSSIGDGPEYRHLKNMYTLFAEKLKVKLYFGEYSLLQYVKLASDIKLAIEAKGFFPKPESFTSVKRYYTGLSIVKVEQLAYKYIEAYEELVAAREMVKACADETAYVIEKARADENGQGMKQHYASVLVQEQTSKQKDQDLSQDLIAKVGELKEIDKKISAIKKAIKANEDSKKKHEEDIAILNKSQETVRENQGKAGSSGNLIRRPSLIILQQKEIKQLDTDKEKATKDLSENNKLLDMLLVEKAKLLEKYNILLSEVVQRKLPTPLQLTTEIEAVRKLLQEKETIFELAFESFSKVVKQSLFSKSNSLGIKERSTISDTEDYCLEYYALARATLKTKETLTSPGKRNTSNVNSNIEKIQNLVNNIFSAVHDKDSSTTKRVHNLSEMNLDFDSRKFVEQQRVIFADGESAATKFSRKTLAMLHNQTGEHSVSLVHKLLSDQLPRLGAVIAEIVGRNYFSKDNPETVPIDDYSDVLSSAYCKQMQIEEVKLKDNSTEDSPQYSCFVSFTLTNHGSGDEIVVKTNIEITVPKIRHRVPSGNFYGNTDNNTLSVLAVKELTIKNYSINYCG